MPGRHRKPTTPILPYATGALGVTAVLLSTASTVPASVAPAPVALASFQADTPVEHWRVEVPRQPVVKPEPAAPAQPAAGTSAAVSQPMSAPLAVRKPTLRRELVKSAAGAPAKKKAPVADPAPGVRASSTAAIAVSVALAQRGTMYRWGGAAPGGFDCSGLTSYAYRKAGISLPRTSSAQSGVGRTVSLDNIRPGDLLFYSGHVAMAIGNGQLVEASTFGKPVATRAIYTRGLRVIKRVA